MHIPRSNYIYINKKNNCTITGKCKLIPGSSRAGPRCLVIKIDDDIEKTMYFVHRILKNRKFDVLRCFVRFRELRQIDDFEKIVRIMYCSGYKFFLSFLASDCVADDEFVELYTIERIKKGCYYG
ncbi:hypothetical protein COBT_000572 [Conglomerata obtusa]